MTEPIKEENAQKRTRIWNSLNDNKITLIHISQQQPPLDYTFNLVILKLFNFLESHAAHTGNWPW